MRGAGLLVVRQASHALLCGLRQVHMLEREVYRFQRVPRHQVSVWSSQMKLSQTIRYSQAASSTTANLLNGTNLQYLGLATKLTIWAAAFLAAAADSFSLAFARGAEFLNLVPAGSVINVDAGGPQQLNDLIGEFAFPAGANLVLALVSDATAGTHTGAFRFVIES